MKPILIDSSTLIYNAFFKYGLTNNQNREVAVIYGFIENFLKLANKFESNELIFCFDSRSNFRKEAFSEYKKRHEAMSETDIKIAKLRRKQEVKLRNNILRQIGFRNIFYRTGFEADDILSYLAKRLKNSYLVTNDADMYQNLDYCDIIDPKGKNIFTKKQFRKKYKIKPSEWAKAKAIGGCQSDNVIGINGASDPKNETSKALKYMTGELTKGKIFDRIESDEGRKIIARNLKLVTCPYLNEDFKLKIKPNRITLKKIQLVLRKYSFNYLLRRENIGQWDIFLN